MNNKLKNNKKKNKKKNSKHHLFNKNNKLD